LAASIVIEDVMTMPWPISILTLAVVAHDDGDDFSL
jgi:hypothetical protein